MGTLNEDIVVNGYFTSKTMKVPDGTITDAAVSAAAAISASKLGHQYEPSYVQGSSSTTAAADTRVLHTVYGATGTTLAFRAGCVVACIGAATITVDLKKNGTSVLSAPISLSSAQTARQVVAATVTVSGLVAGDVLEVVTTATAGGGTIGTGLFAQAVVQETAV